MLLVLCIVPFDEACCCHRPCNKRQHNCACIQDVNKHEVAYRFGENDSDVFVIKDSVI